MFKRKQDQTLVEYVLLCALVAFVIGLASSDLFDGIKTNFYTGLLSTNRQQIDLPPSPDGNRPQTGQKPKAVIVGPDKVHQGDIVEYRSESYDPDGIITRTSWGGDKKNMQFENEGTFTVDLTVWDNDGLSDKEMKQVVVGNQAPNAVIKVTPPNDILWKNGFSISGSESNDPEGDTILDQEWKFNGVEMGEWELGENQIEGKKYVGMQKVELRVMDEFGKWSEWAVKEFNIIGNRKPSVQIIMQPSSGMTEKTDITFSHKFTDPDGDKQGQIEWQNKKSKYPVGTHTVKARVSDEHGLWSDWSSLTFTVVQSNRAPTVTDITWTPSNPNDKSNMSFSYTYSDPDNDSVQTVEWKVDNVVKGNPNGTYSVGSHTISVRIQDARGLWSAWRSETFNVVSSNRPPVINSITHTPNPATEKDTLNFSYSATDPDGDQLTPYWYSSNGQSISPNKKWAIGTHTIKLKVCDPKGLCAEKQYTFSVSQSNRPPVVHLERIENADGRSIFVYSIKDPDGDSIVEHQWKRNGQIVSSTPDDYYPIGTHTVSLRAKDSRGLWSAEKSITFTIEKKNDYRPPTVDRFPGGENLYEPLPSSSEQIGSCDDCSTSVNIGFQFPFYDRTFSTVYINNNGMVSFLSPYRTYSNTSLGSSDAPNYSIYAFWDDLDYRNYYGAGIRVKTLGTAPLRRCIINFYNPNHFSDKGNAIQFSIVLYETGKVQLQYNDVEFGYSEYDNGGSATVGIKKDNSTYEQFSYNQSLLENYSTLTFMPK